MQILYNGIWTMTGAAEQLNSTPMELARAQELKRCKSKDLPPMAVIEVVEAKADDKGNPDNSRIVRADLSKSQRTSICASL